VKEKQHTKVDCALNIRALIVLVTVCRASKKSILPTDEGAAIKSDVISVDTGSESNIAGRRAIQVIRVDELDVIEGDLCAGCGDGGCICVAATSRNGASNRETLGLGDGDLVAGIGLSWVTLGVSNDGDRSWSVDRRDLLLICSGVDEDGLGC
jgi:hypothetical protein